MTPIPAVAYCADSDLAVYCGSDLRLLAPVGQVIAWGSDGVILAQTPWLLSSATAGFVGQGAAVGQVVLLEIPTASSSRPGKTTGRDDQLVIAGVDLTGLTLARGLGAMAGGPPVAAGATGITFKIPTLAPQIDNATYEINQRFGLNSQWGVDPATLLDPRELRQAVAYRVLADQYLAQSHLVEPQDSFLGKHKLYQAKFDEVVTRISIHLQQGINRPSTVRQQARFER